MAAQIPQYLTSAGLTTVFHPLGYAKVLIQVRISPHFIVLMDPTVISTTRNRNHKRNSTDFDTARDSRASDSVINFNFRFELVDYLHNHCQVFGLLYTHQIIVQLESNILSADIDVSTGTGVGNFINISSRYVFSYVICFRFIHFILISTAHALFLTCLPVSIYGT